MVCALPNRAFILAERRSVCPGEVIQAAILRVDLMKLDVMPLLQKSLEIHIRLLAIAFVHHQQGIQPLYLDPPFLVRVVGFALHRPLAVKAAIG